MVMMRGFTFEFEVGSGQWTVSSQTEDVHSSCTLLTAH